MHKTRRKTEIEQAKVLEMKTRNDKIGRERERELNVNTTKIEMVCDHTLVHAPKIDST